MQLTLSVDEPQGGDPSATSMVAVVFELSALAPGSGGTAVISGSHRVDFDRPTFSRADGTAKPPWPEAFGVEVVTVQPGDALIFSEKLLHSTAMYTGAGQRRTLFCTPRTRAASLRQTDLNSCCCHRYPQFARG